MASKREPETREVTCLRCGTINQFKIGIYASGIKTIFCKKCGKEIKLIYYKTQIGLKLKRTEET